MGSAGGWGSRAACIGQGLCGGDKSAGVCRASPLSCLQALFTEAPEPLLAVKKGKVPRGKEEGQGEVAGRMTVHGEDHQLCRRGR